MTKIKSIDYIVSAKHYGNGSTSGYLRKMQHKIYKDRGIAINIKDIDKPYGQPVYARIWQGQWIADCECTGASFVDIDEPIFFCFSCGNRANRSRVRPVVFPDNVKEVERLLLERPVDDVAGLTDLERVGLAKPVIYHEQFGGLSRNWLPSESIDDLKEQNKLIEVWHKKLKE